MLETIIKDYKEGKLKLITVEVLSKAFYRNLRRMKPRKSVYYYLVNKRGERLKINKKHLGSLEVAKIKK